MGDVKAMAQIMNEALHLSLGLGTIWRTQSGDEPMVFRKVPQSRMEAVVACAIGIASQNHRLHVVVQHLARYATKVIKGRLMAIRHSLELLIVYEAHKAHAAIAQYRNKRRQSFPAATKHGPVHLHLLTRLSLEPHGRLFASRRFELADVFANQPFATGIA